MKIIIMLTLIISLCIPAFGCVEEKNDGSDSKISTSASDLSATYSISNPSVASDNSDMSSLSATTSGTRTSGSIVSDSTDDLLSQLEDLEKVIDSLDDISGEDLEIPTPNP